jgi:uncharacterized protein Yka (UPF0111/DUF47 family)
MAQTVPLVKPDWVEMLVTRSDMVSLVEALDTLVVALPALAWLVAVDPVTSGE